MLMNAVEIIPSFIILTMKFAEKMIANRLKSTTYPSDYKLNQM